MHIALLTRRFDSSGGGTERDLIVTAEQLARAGHRVTVYAAEKRGAGEGPEVRLIPTPPLGRALKLWRFAQLAPAIARADGADLTVSFARAIGADVIRSGGGAHVSYLEAARKWRSRWAAAAMRLSPYHRAQMAIERRAFASPHLRLVIAVSDVVRRDLIERFKLPPDKVATLYNGVDLERFRPLTNGATRRRLRHEFDIPGSAPLVIFVGNGFARKGLPFMLEAWPRLKSHTHLLVVGNDNARADYETRVRALKLDGRVHFLGARNDVAELFGAADVLALPSIFEPFGNVVLEAMASGLKVVTSVQAGVCEVLPAEFARFAIRNPCDPIEIAARLDEIIDAPAELGHQARAVAESYSWDRYGANLKRLLEGVA